MSDQRLSDLGSVTTANAGDQLYIVQGGVSKRIAVSSFATSIAVTRLVAAANSSSSVSLTVTIPSTATSTGTLGQIAYNTTHLYLCVATNTWRRLELVSW